MTELNSEMKGTNPDTSPELGFSVQTMSIEELKNTYDEIISNIEHINSLFAHGPSDVLWNKYVAVFKQQQDAIRSSLVDTPTVDAYTRLASLIHKDYVSFVDSEVEDVNSFLLAHPGAIAKDESGSIVLLGLMGQHTEHGEDAIQPEVPPFTLTALWSDDTTQRIDGSVRPVVVVSALALKEHK